MKIAKLLCKIGLHSWEQDYNYELDIRFYPHEFGENYRHVRTCRRCLKKEYSFWQLTAFGWTSEKDAKLMSDLRKWKVENRMVADTYDPPLENKKGI